ncbi:uncharacterized protein SRS1_13603 [Sporisorium reilianum f. sp. reilianum]|uniref:Uncharacterized protein n=1 Tax=Sporisorium reilianum f. sp. reilianum TaxID=72559 RepID=A0A2N8UN18_9BASI|nr:uncharacterized protein SRS1_13603 [Sporisorium reilianum f. sp. reilianum]
MAESIGPDPGHDEGRHRSNGQSPRRPDRQTASADKFLPGTSLPLSTLTSPLAFVCEHESIIGRRMTFIGRIHSVTFSTGFIMALFEFDDAEHVRLVIKCGSQLYHAQSQHHRICSEQDSFLIRNVVREPFHHEAYHLGNGWDVPTLTFDVRSSYKNITKARYSTTFEDVIEANKHLDDSIYDYAPDNGPSSSQLVQDSTTNGSHPARTNNPNDPQSAAMDILGGNESAMINDMDVNQSATSQSVGVNEPPTTTSTGVDERSTAQVAKINERSMIQDSAGNEPSTSGVTAGNGPSTTQVTTFNQPAMTRDTGVDEPSSTQAAVGNEPSTSRIAGDNEASMSRSTLLNEHSTSRVSAGNEPVATPITAGSEHSSTRATIGNDRSTTRVSAGNEPSTTQATVAHSHSTTQAAAGNERSATQNPAGNERSTIQTTAANDAVGGAEGSMAATTNLDGNGPPREHRLFGANLLSSDGFVPPLAFHRRHPSTADGSLLMFVGHYVGPYRSYQANFIQFNLQLDTYKMIVVKVRKDLDLYRYLEDLGGTQSPLLLICGVTRSNIGVLRCLKYTEGSRFEVISTANGCSPEYVYAFNKALDVDFAAANPAAANPTDEEPPRPATRIRLVRRSAP